MNIEEYKLNTEVRDTDIRTLMGDSRFNAILALISSCKDEMVIYTTNPANAHEPYRNTHNLGSISALLSLETQLIYINSTKNEDDVT